MSASPPTEIKPPPVSPGRLLALYPAVWLACIPLVCWLGDFSKLRVRLESLAYPALLLLMFTAPAVQKLWRETPPAPRWSAVCLLLFLVNAQLLARNEITYPVPAWTMYAAKRPVSLTYAELVTVRTDGTQCRYPLGKHVAATRSFYSIINDQMDKERSASDAGRQESAGIHRAAWNHLLREVADQVAASGEVPAVTELRYVRRHLGNDGAVVRTEILATLPVPSSPEPQP